MTEIIVNSAPAIHFLQQVTDNVIRLPALQRDFVWGNNNAKDLFDSIYRDFPIGNFYIWSPPKSDDINSNITSALDIENENVHNNATSVHNDSSQNVANKKAKYILDGQQRITTLYRVYNKVEGTNVYFEPASEKFLAGGRSRLYSVDPSNDSKSRKKDSVISVHEVWNTTPKTFDDVWKNSPFTEEEKQRIKKLNRILNSFLVDVHELRDHSLEQVMEIFKRINKTGKSLTWAESLAMPSLVKSVPSIKNDIDKLRKNLSLSSDMGKLITTDFIAQSIIWCMDGYTKEVKSSYSFDEINTAFNIVAVGLREVLDILNRNLGIKTKNMIGSGVPIIIASIAAGKTLLELEYYIPLKKSKDDILSGKCSLKDKDRSRVALYYIASTTFGTYSQGSSLQANKKAHIDSMKKNTADHCSILFSLAEDILKEAKVKARDGNNFINVEELFGVRYSSGKGSPFFILLGIILSTAGASNFISESHPIDFSTSHRHHIYPHSRIPNYELRHGIGNITYISEFVNQIISNQLPDEYLKVNYSVDKLKKHLFPDKFAEDISKMDEHSYEAFITERTEVIKTSFNNFIAALVDKAK